MAGCTMNWSWTGENLLLNGQRPTQADIQSSLRVYEANGCQCGKGLDCPIMLYLLHDTDEEEDDWNDSDEDWDDTPSVAPPSKISDEKRLSAPPFGDPSSSFYEEQYGSKNDYDEDDDEEDDWDDNAPWDDDNFEIDETGVAEPSRFEFAEDDRLFVPTPTSVDEQEIVDDVFDQMPVRHYGEPPIRHPDDNNRVTSMVDHFERKQNEVMSISEKTARLSRENKLLREKLSELEGQVNQQLREIGIRQKETGHFEDEMQNIKGENMSLIRGMLMCLKLLKFLPDKHKMNFKNSNDYRQMMEIYKKYVEPKKGDVK
jgi:hypothetical protein